MTKKPDFLVEKRLWAGKFKLIIGVDEVGRGAFAGPVVVGACALRLQNPSSKLPNIREIEKIGINDSKRLSEKKRKEVAKEIKKHFFWSLGESTAHQINTFGIVKATNIAVRKAVIKVLYMAFQEKNNISQKKGLMTKDFIESLKPYLLLDAFHVKYVPVVGLRYQQVIVGGDGKSITIAASSIIAKVYRDRLMKKLDKIHPKYAWGKNSGYGTEEHRQALQKHGATKLHRQQFIKKWVGK